MRLLIDGYNLMYATGILTSQLTGEQFRKAREKFLNLLALYLDPLEAHLTAVVFDAALVPVRTQNREKFPYKGMQVTFAIHDKTADDHIEDLIAVHKEPNRLTVVSSDHRVRAAAGRRKARSLTCDDFLIEIDRRKLQPKLHERQAFIRPEIALSPPRDPRKPAAPVRSREDDARIHGLTPQETEFWLKEFQDVVADPNVRKELSPDEAAFSQMDIEQMQREIDREWS